MCLNSSGVVGAGVRGLCGVFGRGGGGHRSVRPQAGQPSQEPGTVGPRSDSSQDPIPQRKVQWCRHTQPCSAQSFKGSKKHPKIWWGSVSLSVKVILTESVWPIHKNINVYKTHHVSQHIKACVNISLSSDMKCVCAAPAGGVRWPAGLSCGCRWWSWTRRESLQPWRFSLLKTSAQEESSSSDRYHGPLSVCRFERYLWFIHLNRSTFLSLHW